MFFKKKKTEQLKFNEKVLGMKFENVNQEFFLMSQTDGQKGVLSFKNITPKKIDSNNQLLYLKVNFKLKKFLIV